MAGGAQYLGATSLPLQIALYTNAVLSVFYATIGGAVAVHKVQTYRYESMLHRYVYIPVFVLWGLAEAMRLYFGITGNLQEKVSHVSTFLLMCVFPVAPFMCYLGYLQELLAPIDLLCVTFLCVLLVFEAVVGWRVAQNLIKSQTAQFMRLCQNEDFYEGVAARDKRMY